MVKQCHRGTDESWGCWRENINGQTRHCTTGNDDTLHEHTRRVGRGCTILELLYNALRLYASHSCPQAVSCCSWRSKLLLVYDLYQRPAPPSIPFCPPRRHKVQSPRGEMFHRTDRRAELIEPYSFAPLEMGLEHVC